jgi:RNase P subunit RPR2
MCMADYADDQCSIYRAKIQRTRKPRKCDECSRPIAVGERYENAFMVYEGHADTFVTCEHCLVGSRWLVENCGGFLHCGVWEDLEEHISEYPRLAFPLSRLKVARRRMWRRFDGTGLMAVPPVPPTLEAVGL